MGCGCAGYHRDHKHADKGNRVSVQRKIQLQIGIGKKIIHAYHAHHRRCNPRQISAGQPRNKQQGQGIKHHYINIAGRYSVIHKSRSRGYEKHSKGNCRILPCTLPQLVEKRCLSPPPAAIFIHCFSSVLCHCIRNYYTFSRAALSTAAKSVPEKWISKADHKSRPKKAEGRSL